MPDCYGKIVNEMIGGVVALALPLGNGFAAFGVFVLAHLSLELARDHHHFILGDFQPLDDSFRR